MRLCYCIYCCDLKRNVIFELESACARFQRDSHLCERGDIQIFNRHNGLWSHIHILEIPLARAFAYVPIRSLKGTVSTLTKFKTLHIILSCQPNSCIIQSCYYYIYLHTTYMYIKYLLRYNYFIFTLKLSQSYIKLI